jgi:hypothetical protein
VSIDFAAVSGCPGIKRAFSAVRPFSRAVSDEEGNFASLLKLAMEQLDD